MIVSVDFSLYSKSNEPYGNVTGDVDLPTCPAIGERLTLLEGIDGGAAFDLRVDGVLEGEGAVTLLLEDHVAGSALLAEAIGSRLERESDLFLYRYADE